MARLSKAQAAAYSARVDAALAAQKQKKDLAAKQEENRKHNEAFEKREAARLAKERSRQVRSDDMMTNNVYPI